MKKNSSKNIFACVAFVGLVVVVALYMLVYQEYKEKTKLLQSQNATLKSEISSMEIHYLNREAYRQDTEAMRTAITDMVAAYPADAREEDVVMMVVDMQNVSEIQYDEINIDEAEVLYTVPAEDVVKTGVEGLENTVEFVERQTTYSGEMNYESLKACIQQIYSNSGRIGVHNVSIMKEENMVDGNVTNRLKGNIDVSFYSMTGTGKEYKAPSMPAYTAGTTNPFRLILDSED